MQVKEKSKFAGGNIDNDCHEVSVWKGGSASILLSIGLR